MSIWEMLFLRKTKAEVAPGWLALAFGIGYLSVKYIEWKKRFNGTKKK
jgi:hypothetical protein